MKGSRIAGQIINDMKRQEYYQKKVTRRKCIKEGEKKCDKCWYANICDDVEIKEEEETE